MTTNEMIKMSNLADIETKKQHAELLKAQARHENAKAAMRESQLVQHEQLDTDKLPNLPTFKLCPECGLPAAVKECDVRDCNHMLGYSMQRLRVVTHCDNCNQDHVYRTAWMEIKNGSYVKKSSHDKK